MTFIDCAGSSVFLPIWSNQGNPFLITGHVNCIQSNRHRHFGRQCRGSSVYFRGLGILFLLRRNYFIRLGHIDFPADNKLIFAIFKKYPVPSIDNIALHPLCLNLPIVKLSRFLCFSPLVTF